MKFERLGNIAKNLDNRRIPLNSVQRESKSKKELYPYIGANNIMGYIDEYIFDEKILCIAEDGGSWGAGQICTNIYNEKCWVNNHAHVLVENGKAKLEYLRYFLNQTDLNKYITGSTRGKLTKSALESILVPLPSLETQIHIANILTKAENLITQRKECIRLLDEYLKSTFLEMFGDPVKNEKGWEKKTIAEIGKDEKRAIKAGPFGSQLLLSELQPDGIPVYGIDNVQKNKFIEAKPKFITENKFLELIAFKIEEEDILITRTGTVGRTCLAPKNIDKCIIGPNLLKISLDRSKALPIYISIAFNYCESIVDSIKQLSPGATVAVFNTTNLKAIKLGIPPITLQTKFAQIVEKTEALKAQFQQSLQELANLYGSLSQRAFRGELEIKEAIKQVDYIENNEVSMAAEPISEYKK